MKQALYKDFENKFRKIEEMGLIDITLWQQKKEEIFGSIMPQA
jgi:hypothetical protein